MDVTIGTMTSERRLELEQSEPWATALTNREPGYGVFYVRRSEDGFRGAAAYAGGLNVDCGVLLQFDLAQDRSVLAVELVWPPMMEASVAVPSTERAGVRLAQEVPLATNQFGRFFATWKPERPVRVLRDSANGLTLLDLEDCTPDRWLAPTPELAFGLSGRYLTKLMIWAVPGAYFAFLAPQLTKQ